METPLTQHIIPGEPPATLKQYKKAGGFEGVEKALRTLKPGEVIDMVKNSGLTGRGGAGFVTGLKWTLVPKGEPIKYFIANADEMEPGTFKDRYLMESNPHQLLAGMIIGSYAIGAETAYIFIRWAYMKAEAILKKAIEEAYREGYLGKNILGSGFNLDIHVHSSAGRYICGEETALLSSLEGKRGIPKTKPPYAVTKGLFGKPTVINNVETLCWISHIVENGPEWFKKLSLTNEGGTKLYGISGNVKKPGLWELPMGTPLREILDVHAGGMKDGFTLRGIIPGGASTDFLTPDHLDIKMDFNSVQEAGSRLGTGTMIVLDDKTCPVKFIHNLIRFFADESCGWCTPCREGLPWAEKILASMENGTARHGDIEILESLTHYMAPGHTFCAHAPGAMEPLQSGLKYYREDFEKHILDKHCPWK
jgi:NADH-quinone oxidoreductase subunit F